MVILNRADTLSIAMLPLLDCALTVITWLLGFDKLTVNWKAVLPALPSARHRSLIKILGRLSSLLMVPVPLPSSSAKFSVVSGKAWYREQQQPNDDQTNRNTHHPLQ
jgi:hypothetical protein